MPSGTNGRRLREGALVLVLVVPAFVRPVARPSGVTDAPPVDRIRTQLGQGRYEDAESEARTRFASLEAEAGDARDAARDLYVEALVRNGRGARPTTRALAEDAVRAHEPESDRTAAALASALRNLGDVLLDAGEFQRGLATFQRTLAVRERAVGRDHPEFAEDLDHLAQAQIWLERYDGALATTTEALATRESRLPASSAALARTLRVRALAWQRKGDYRQAGIDLRRGVAIHEAAYPAHPETAALLTRLGEQLWFEGDLVQSRQVLERAVAMSETVLRPEHPSAAVSRTLLAIPLHDLGDLPAARALREQALPIVEQAYGPVHPLVAIQLSDLAVSLVRQGEYARARVLYQRALDIYERRLGPNHSYAATVVYNLAMLHGSLGDFLEAARLHNRAIRTWERVAGRDHQFVAWALTGFADMLSDSGRNREAIRLYERAVAIRERTFNSNHALVALTLAKLANGQARVGNLSRASALSERAMAIWDASGRPVGLSEVLLAQARIQLARGDYLTAQDAYDRLIEARLPLFGAAHPSIGEAEAGRARALAGLGRTSEALRASLHADEIGRNHLQMTLAYLPERQGLGYAARLTRGLDVSLSLLADERAGAPVLDALIRGRALVLDEIASRRRTLAGSADADVAALWQTLTSTSQRLANLAIKGPLEANPTQYAVLLDEARRDKDAAERALAERSAVFRSQLSRTSIGLDGVRAALPAGSALVSFVRYDRSRFGAAAPPTTSPGAPTPASRPSSPAVASYAAFVLRAGDPDPVLVRLGSARTIDPLVANWRAAIMATAGSAAAAPASPATSLPAAGAKLRRALWDPIAAHLTHVTRVFVVPDGAVNLAPLAALPVGGGRFLLDAGPVIHHLSAERDLVVLGDTNERVGAGLLAIGGPSFADDSLFAALAPRSGAPRKGPLGSKPTLSASASSPSASDAFRGSRSACATFQTMQFEPLPASRREAEDVARLWRDSHPGDDASSETLTGPQANERAFKSQSAGRRVIHLATHGFFLGGECASALDGARGVGGLVAAAKPGAAPRRPPSPENPLLLSGLAFAGANRRAAAGADEDDGILTSEEVTALNLSGVEWAVLSACDTGLGELRAHEGVFGLRRAFQSAGVRTVIMSLWPIEDRSARAWMRALYDGRWNRGLSTADAVREASLTVLRQRRARGLGTDPFHWAAFVAAGDWR